MMVSTPPTVNKENYATTADWTVAALAIYFCTFVFEGVYRWVLAEIGLSPLIYTRDVLLIILILRKLVPLKATKTFEPLKLLAFLLLAIIITVQLWTTANSLQTIFGMKIFLPFLVGALYGNEVATFIENSTTFFATILALTFIGVLSSKFLELPWEGMLVNVGDTTVNVGKVWWAGEWQRLSGFARTSYDAAVYALLSYAVLANKLKNIRQITAIIFTAATIILTTTKATALAFVIVASMAMITRMPIAYREQVWKSSIITVAICFTTASIILPTASVGMKIGTYIHDPIYKVLFFSFLDRMSETWPSAINLVNTQVAIFFGNGPGAIGAAQAYFNPQQFNPADNMYVYAYVTGGLLFSGIILINIFKTIARAIKHGYIAVAHMMLIVCIYGLTTNLFDNPAFALLIGLTIYFQPTQRHKPQ